jgi:hypothetical protein
MKMIAIEKIRSKLKVWSIEMPNAPYSNRYLQARSKVQKNIIHK